ncbi:hypothetical protein LOTGIDRAFT_229966 [Lottia gigantea]|uniref:DRBM domain-containing protein n=1 Tax=Lottia gigantea TaxID=225164 RepID=V4BBG5_LOTGI|nr:hypothetical protein LOTGIDRAFT_229966 [Lottia gigantea]ESP04881.1 hypothetical protein LOTGIDRAFT_229966 [Lottia gigantea]
MAGRGWGRGGRGGPRFGKRPMEFQGPWQPKRPRMGMGMGPPPPFDYGPDPGMRFGFRGPPPPPQAWGRPMAPEYDYPQEWASPEENLQKFIEFVLFFPPQGGSINTVQRALNDSGIDLRLHCKMDDVKDSEEPEVEGELHLGTFFLSKGRRKNRNLLRKLLFDIAYWKLMTKTVGEICLMSNEELREAEKKPEETEKMETSDDTETAETKPDVPIKTEPGTEEATEEEKPAETSEGEKSDAEKKKTPLGRRSKMSFKYFSPRLKERLKHMKQSLPKGKKVYSIADMNMAAASCGMTLTLVHYRQYKSSTESDPVSCEIYADEMYLSKGEGADPKEAGKNAYIKSRDYLLSTPVHVIIKDQKRLSELNKDDPLILDIIHRGPFHEIGSNSGNLKAWQLYPPTTEKNTFDIIILEHAEQKNQAFFKILETSATQNGMALDWCVSGRHDDAPQRCQIFLQKRMIADAKAQNKMKAKNFAANHALQRFSNSQTLIKYQSRDCTKTTFTYEEIQQKAIKLKMESPEVKQEVKQEESMETDAGTEEVSEEKKQQQEMEEWINKALDIELQNFFGHDTVEEMVMGADFPDREQKWVRKQAYAMGVHTFSIPAKRVQVLFQSRSHTADKILQVLLENDGTFGRYKLYQVKQTDQKTAKRYLNTEEQAKADEEKAKKEAEKAAKEAEKAAAAEEVPKEEPANGDEQMVTE